ncbi:Nmral1, partial [Symbiodinium sp. CCMP2592]
LATHIQTGFAAAAQSTVRSGIPQQLLSLAGGRSGLRSVERFSAPDICKQNVFKAQVPRAPGLPLEPPTAPPADPFAGLPIACLGQQKGQGQGPSGWRGKMHWPKPSPDCWTHICRGRITASSEVIDARPEEHGGIVILQAVLSDSHATWGNSKDAQRLEDRPDWLRAILATNRAHAKTHGHAMVLRAHPTEPQLTDWMISDCGKKSLRVCAKVNERETYNWEKHLMMQDYLLSPQAFTHVLMLDADAALIQPQLNTLHRIADILDRKGKDLFLTNEDWLDQNGEARINGGLMLAKNTQFTQNLFQDTFDAHVAGYKLLKKARIGTPVIRCTRRLVNPHFPVDVMLKAVVSKLVKRSSLYMRPAYVAAVQYCTIKKSSHDPH